MKISYGPDGNIQTDAPAAAVLIHGLWGSSQQFRPWMLRSPDRVTVALDLLGHGPRSVNTSLDRLSLHHYASDAITEIASRRLGTSIDLLGHSAGGIVALLIAATQPDLVRSVTLLASDPTLECGVKVPFQAKFLRGNLGINLGMALATGKAFNLTEGQAEVVADGAEVKFGTESGRAFREILLSPISVPPRLIKCPVHVIAASNDQFLPVSLQKKIAETYDATFAEVPGTHMCNVHQEYRDKVMETAEQYFAPLSRSFAA